jgi:NADH-quinone oxidoreductase subunit H
LTFVCALSACVFAMGCEVASSPQLIQVNDFSPHEAEVGDRLELLGAGFPQGRAAVVTFRGTLYRPGEAPITGVEIPATGTVTSPQQVELEFTEALQALFAGPPEKAAHTTFEGEVEVAFAAVSTGAPPIGGTLHALSFDVRPPPPRPALADARIAEGEKVLAFLGLEVADRTPISGGLEILRVVPGSPADRGGVVAGDVLTKLGHVQVGSKADLVPSPGARAVTLALRRTGLTSEQAREVSLEGFSGGPGPELLLAVALVAAAVVVVFLFVAPTPAPLVRIEQAVVTHWTRGPEAWRARLRGLASEILGGGERPSVRYAFQFLFVALALLLLALPQSGALAELDVGILFLVVTTALVTTSLVTARSWREGLGAAVRLASFEIPAAVALLAVVGASGSVHLRELVRVQGGAPWGWNVFRSPVFFALFVLFFTRVLRDDLAPSAGRLAALRLHRVLTCALAVALFLGGWQVPGLDGVEVRGRVPFALAAGALFVVKTGLVAALVVAVRTVLARPYGVQAWSARRSPLVVCWTRAVPASFAALGLAVAWMRWDPSPEVERVVSASLIALVLVTSAHLIWQVIRQTRAGEPAVDWARLNPFL